MKKYKVKKDDQRKLAKSFFWLAYQACGGPLGMGFLQARDSVTADDVINNVETSGDYHGDPHTADGEYYGDYVFGRMMKTGLRFNGQEVSVDDEPARPDYQAWCHKYPSQNDLFMSAAADAGVDLVQIL